MSLSSSIMTGTVLGAALPLLLFASFIQGLQDVKVKHFKAMEAVAGQNVSLPCLVENHPGLFNIVQIEWSIRDAYNTKLVVYNRRLGSSPFRPNVSIQIQYDEEKKLMGSYLKIQGVEKWDSGVYICDITAFPVGSIRRETELKVKAVDTITCDRNHTFEVNAGENVTIHCTADVSESQYRWTKDKKVVSENKSLELWWVSDAQSGVYTLTVNTGNSSLHTEFIITVLTATTSLGAGVTTTPPRSSVSEEGVIQTRTPADTDHTTSSSIGHPSTSTSITWTMVTDANETADNTKPYDVTTSDGMRDTSLGAVPSFTNRLNISVTSPPGTRSHTDRSHSTTDLTVTMTQEMNHTHNLTTNPVTEQARTYPEASSLTWAEESSTLGTAKMTSENPGVSSTLSDGENTAVVIETDTGGGRSYLLLIIFPVLALIALLGILSRRHIIRKRMDLPPPFKPPPPPVKYSAVRLLEIPTTDILS